MDNYWNLMENNHAFFWNYWRTPEACEEIKGRVNLKKKYDKYLFPTLLTL